jgi:hypothetical protein
MCLAELHRRGVEGDRVTLEGLNLGQGATTLPA